MPIEGHAMDCGCDCCMEEEAPQSTGHACICPACGKRMPHEPGKACNMRKCPSCGADMQPGK